MGLATGAAAPRPGPRRDTRAIFHVVPFALRLDLAVETIRDRHHRRRASAGGLAGHARFAQTKNPGSNEGGSRRPGMTHNTESHSATTADSVASANASAGPAPDQSSVPNGLPDDEAQPRAPHPITGPGNAAIDWGDVIISAALLIIFIAAFVNALQWEAIAALF